MVNVSLKPYFEIESLAFCEDASTALANDFQFGMALPCRIHQDRLMADADSFAKLMALGWTKEQSRSIPRTELSGHLFLPVGQVLAEQFGWTVRERSYRGKRMIKASKLPDFPMDPIGLYYLFEQTCGIVKKAFYLEEARTLIAYRLYVPVSCPTSSPDSGPRKLAVILHGLGGGNVFDRADNKLAHMGQRYNYLILAPLAYTNGMHGSAYPMARDFTDMETADPSNPANLTEEEQRIYRLCELADMQALEEVRKQYGVDGGNIFLGGNSMGGDGTFYLASRYPDVFRAIAPCAGGPDLRFFPAEQLRELPVRLLCGTEDSGFHLLLSMYRELKDRGVPAEFAAVGGETHGTAWLHDLEGMFDFFNRMSAESSER
ncbi:hypothetical protein [uncultured Clostridium sp.]|uniref:hypothetical protein n=1 Tax=uncultured Clostridium sp. TaxID=59620 RepID=UPI0025ECF95D|nr:hypothetical protein [uncultured Clostridium sp.]